MQRSKHIVTFRASFAWLQGSRIAFSRSLQKRSAFVDDANEVAATPQPWPLARGRSFLCIQGLITRGPDMLIGNLMPGRLVRRAWHV